MKIIVCWNVSSLYPSVTVEVEAGEWIEASEMKNMLESFIREGEMKVKRTGTCHGFTYEAMWVEDGGDKPDVTVSKHNKKGLKIR